MAHWCESCGQQLPEGAEPSDATWLGEPGEAHQHSFARPDRVKKPGGEKKVLLALGALVLLWGAVVVIGRVVTPDDSIDNDVAAELEDDRVEREVSRALAEADADREAAEREAAEASAADAAGIDDPGDGRVIIAAAGRQSSMVQIERLQRQLTRRSSQPIVAYQSAEGTVIIDLSSGETTVKRTTQDAVAQAQPGDQVLRVGAASYAINPDTLEVSLVGDGSSLVVSSTIDGNTYFVDAKALGAQSPLVDVLVDGTYSAHRTPSGGFQLLAVDGLGLLAVPQGPAGETLIAGAESFEAFRPNRVLTGTATAVLEQVCLSEDSCSLAITDLATEDQIPVPTSFVRFGDQYAVSPDGRSLVRYSPQGFAEVFVADDDSIAWVVGAGMRAPAWGQDSNLIAWLDRIGDPSLNVMFPDERDWLNLDLGAFGAPPPTGPELIVFGPMAPVAEAADA